MVYPLLNRIRIYIAFGSAFKKKLCLEKMSIWIVNTKLRVYIFLSFIIVFVLKMPIKDDPICPRNIDPFDIVSYYIKWVTASWT